MIANVRESLAGVSRRSLLGAGSGGARAAAFGAGGLVAGNNANQMTTARMDADVMMRASEFDPERLSVKQATMARHAGTDGLPGLVTLISRSGETVIQAYGTMTVAGDAPMREDTIFRIASLTKPFVAVAAMTLVEDGSLRLDDPVDTLLPELANRQVLRSMESELSDTVPADRPITPAGPADAHPGLRRHLRHAGHLSHPTSDGRRGALAWPSYAPDDCR